MADTTDPKANDNQGDNAQGGAFGGVPFDEAQKKPNDVGFSLDMDDLPDLDDIALDLNDDSSMEHTEEATGDDLGGLDATGDISLDDINLDDISLDDISMDGFEGETSAPLPSTDTVTTPPESGIPEISLADLYSKPLKKETSVESKPAFDLGDLELPEAGKSPLSTTPDLPIVDLVKEEVIEKEKKIITAPVVEDTTKDDPSLHKEVPKKREEKRAFETRPERTAFKKPAIRHDSFKKSVPNNNMTHDASKKRDISHKKPVETVVAVAGLAQKVEKIEIPLGASKVVKKFIGVLNTVREGASLMNEGEMISVVGIHTDKQHIDYDFTHDDQKSFTVVRNATDPTTDQKSLWTLKMAYDDMKKNFSLILDDVAVYSETNDIVSDKDLQHTVADKLGKFSLLLGEFVSKKKKKQEELLRAEEEKRKQRDVMKKLREF